MPLAAFSVNKELENLKLDQVDAPSPYAPSAIGSGLSVVGPPSQNGGPLTLSQESTDYGVCIYDVQSGNYAVAPSNPTQSHFQNQQLTNLTGVAVPGTQQPLPATDLPGCSVGDSFSPNTSTYYFNTVDCAIAKAVNGMPAGCESNPQGAECILYLFPAFCGDSTSDIEYCLRRIPLGPCVANPGGAACLSGQFPGIQFVVGGGNSSSSKRDNSDPLFGDNGQDLVPLEDQFWIGKKHYLIMLS